MPNAQNNPNAVNARRFAALLAGFDIGNASDEEAVSKGIALRRMAKQANTRIVDLLELPYVRQAIDDQLQPVRSGNTDLQQARKRAEELREELTERTRDVRKLAELLRQQKETTEAMRRDFALAQSQAAGGRVHAASSSPPPGVSSWRVVAGAVLFAVALVIAMHFGAASEERSNGYGLGDSEGASAGAVHESGAIHPVPKPGAVHHRVRNSGGAAGTR